MLLPTLLLLATSVSAPCARPPRHTGRWLRGEYLARPVIAERQTQVMARLGSRSLERIDLPLARAATGDSGIAPAKHYYLAKAAYVGGPRRPTALPAGTSFGVDVDTRGIAYITSFRLTREHGASPVAVVLISDTALTGVVAGCTAAA